MLYPEYQKPKKQDTAASSLQKLLEVAARNVQADAALYATATNAVATATLAAVTGVKNVIDGVTVSYSATSSGGKLQVKDGTTVVYEADIPVAAGVYAFRVKRKSTAGTALNVVLAAGGSGVVGKVNIENAWLEK